MNTSHASSGSTDGGFSMFVPLLLMLAIGLVYAFLLGSIAKRKGKNQTLWFLAALVPLWNIIGGIWLSSFPEKSTPPKGVQHRVAPPEPQTWKCTCGITNHMDLPNCPEYGLKRDYLLKRVSAFKLH